MKNTDEQTLINPYPKEYGYLRIGTPVNMDFNKALYDYKAFDMTKLANKGYLRKNVNSSQYKNIQGGGLDQKSQKAFSMGIAGSLGLRKMVDCSFSSEMSYSQNICNSKTQNYILAYANESTDILMEKSATVDDLLTCVSSDFLTMYLEIVNNAAAIEKDGDAEKDQDKKKLQKALRAFYKKYGTGFISELHLGTYAIFKGTAQYTSDLIENKLKIGGKYSISGVTFGAEGAAQYCNEHFDAKQEGHFHVETLSIPANSPLKDWITPFFQNFTDAQLSKINKLDPWQRSFEPKIPSVTEVKFKEKQPEEKKDTPKPSEEVMNAATNQMKLEDFKEKYKKDHGVYPSDPAKAYADYLNELKKSASADDNQINRGEVSPRNLTSPILGPNIREANLRDNIDTEDVDFGSYGITGYEYTEWGEVFPALRGISRKLTFSNVAMGHILIWISIRQLFSQYLSFCTKFTGAVADGIAANSFKTALESTVKEICNKFTADNLDENLSLQALEKRFRENLTKERFVLLEHYQYLIDNYEWLKRIPFGAVPIVSATAPQNGACRGVLKNGWWFDKYAPYTKQDSLWSGKNSMPTRAIESNNPPSAETLIKENAVRLYPILATDNSNKPFFIWLNAVEEECDHELCGISLYTVKDLHELDHIGDWGGMFRSVSPFINCSFKNIADCARHHGIHVMPEESTYNNNVWAIKPTNGKRPKVCSIEYASDVAECTFITSVTGSDINVGYDITTETVGEIRLVPIDYKDVANAGNEVKSGGPPMWFQPKTNDFLNELHDLTI